MIMLNPRNVDVADLIALIRSMPDQARDISDSISDHVSCSIGTDIDDLAKSINRRLDAIEAQLDDLAGAIEQMAGGDGDDAGGTPALRAAPSRPPRAATATERTAP